MGRFLNCYCPISAGQAMQVFREILHLQRKRGGAGGVVLVPRGRALVVAKWR